MRMPEMAFSHVLFPGDFGLCPGGRYWVPQGLCQLGRLWTTVSRRALNYTDEETGMTTVESGVVQVKESHL